jgi:hypothetical protein
VKFSHEHLPLTPGVLKPAALTGGERMVKKKRGMRGEEEEK